VYFIEKEKSIQLRELYNLNDSLSKISISIPSGLILPDPKTKKRNGTSTLKYEVIAENKRMAIVDSASYQISDTAESQSMINHTWTFKAASGSSYFVKVVFIAPGLLKDFVLLEYLDKSNHSSQSWYRFKSNSETYLPNNTTTFSQPLRLISNDTSSRNFTVKFFSRDFAYPIPPFIDEYRPIFNFVPDSSFSLKVRKGISDYFRPVSNGIYFFLSDTNKLEAPTLFKTQSSFPKVTLHSMMLEPLKYITSTSEFQQLSVYTLPKLAIDSFWIANTGRPDLATELIRKYYKRVEIANELFSSYTEGWKTDRGMIYIVMGRPLKAFRNFNQEVWIFGDSEGPNSVKFYFHKAKNPFSNNDYVLSRNPYYKTIWFQYVSSWRR